MQAVRKLDDHHAHILCNCKEQFAKVFGLRFFLAQNFAFSGFGELCNAIYHAGDIIAKMRTHGIKRNLGTILHYIMQKPGNDCVAVHSHIEQHLRHRFRVRIIGFSRFALLIFMRLLSKGDRVIQKLHFLLRKTLADGFGLDG